MKKPKKPQPPKNLDSLANAPYAEFLIEMAEQINQVVFVFDVDTSQFLYLNPSFESIWTMTRESVSTHPENIVKSIHKDDLDFLTHAYQELKEGTEQNVEFRIIHPDDSEATIRLSAFLMKTRTGKVAIAGFATDVTEYKKYSDILKRHAAKKNSILEILSHDLAGPLSSIQGLVTILERKSQKKEDIEILQLIKETSARGITLIRDFVKQEFLESADVELIKTRVDLVSKILQVIEQYKLSEQTIAKTFHFKSSSEKIYAEIDEVKFIQVINNLISNAIKFTYDGGIITTSVEEKKDYILISIQDNGIGIPEHMREGLFEKFTKARRPGIKGEPSVGLGMSISKTIVEWHNGNIQFDSQENKGTTFYIEIPK
jgi:two-component system sensor histidine kinase VicK